MTINFTGIKNISGYSESNNSGSKITMMNMELTNKNERDLDNFSSILKEYPNKTNKNFVNLTYANFNGREQYILNNKRLPVERETLKTFSKLAKLMTKVEKSQDKFELNNDFINGDDSKEMLEQLVNSSSNKSPIEQIFDLHNFNSVKNNASEMKTNINNTMMDYLA